MHSGYVSLFHVPFLQKREIPVDRYGMIHTLRQFATEIIPFLVSSGNVVIAAHAIAFGVQQIVGAVIEGSAEPFSSGCGDQKTNIGNTPTVPILGPDETDEKEVFMGKGEFTRPGICRA